MKVYDCKGFPNPARVRIALAEKRMLDQVEFVQVDVPGGEHRRPEFLAKNPSGAVPVLELDDGTLISESAAITDYLDHADGDPILTGRDARERAIIHMAQRKVESGLLDAVGAYFHHATSGLGPAIEIYQNRDWGLRQRDVALATMRRLDGVLAGQDYMAGDRFTVADITAMAGLIFAGFAKIDTPAECAHLEAWRARVWSRPSAAAAA